MKENIQIEIVFDLSKFYEGLEKYIRSINDLYDIANDTVEMVTNDTTE